MIHSSEVSDFIELTIQDQGSGIPDKDLQKIFDPYFTTKSKGSGLGLASAYSIVKNHGGRIAVQSELQKGTIFTIYLPVSNKPVSPQQEFEMNKSVSGHGRILIMDDEPLIRDVTSQMLQQIGYEVVAANDGAEAIERYLRAIETGTRFDAVIMDLTIPGGMGGKEAIKKLREIDPNMKAIVSSGYSSDPVMANYQDYGFDGFISKPYKMDELGRALQTVMKK